MLFFIRSRGYVSLQIIVMFLLLVSPVVNGAEISPNLFAMINGKGIEAGRYTNLLQSSIRQKYYHAKIPQQELIKYRKDISQKLIDQSLLLQEAERRNIEPDNRSIELQFEQYDKQYKNSPRYQVEREQMLKKIRPQLEQKSKIERITQQLRRVTRSSEQETRKYYANNTEKFTTPAKNKISVILLSVDPSSSADIWRAAEEESLQIFGKLKKGESFSDLASLHSSDESASKGGDMGYLHKGMLNKKAEAAIDKMKVGEIMKPLKLLQGYAIFRVDERVEKRLNDFDNVKDRAKKLADREKSDRKFTKFMQHLRSNANIILNDKLISQEIK